MNTPTALIRRPPATARITLWIRERNRSHLYRNAYALVGGSWITSALGLVFWIVAARSYPAASLGVGAALISAMTLLAAIAQLNLKNALTRFLPTAGPRAAGFVLRAYGAALLGTAVVSAIFLAGLGIWSPDLRFMGENAGLVAWFIVTTMAWAVFVLQDSVLAGIRQAAWVPLENGVFAVAKIAMLVVLAAAAPTIGVYLAWTFPVLAIVLPVNWLLFRRLIPRHASEARPAAATATTPAVARYLAGDSLAYVIWAGTIGALPLIVLALAGAEANAGFFVSWSIAYALYLVSSGMGMSLLAEGARNEHNIERDARRIATEAARIVIPAVAVLVLAAPVLLAALGNDYAGDAMLLRLLALSAIPYVVVATAATVARVRRRIGEVVLIYAILCGLVLALGVPLLLAFGTVGIGVAWLAAQTLVAVIIVLRIPGAFAWLSRTRAAGLASLRWASVGRAARPVLAALQARLGAGRRQWKIVRAVPTAGDVAVAAAGAGDRPEAFIKLALSDASVRSLADGRSALIERAADQLAPGFAELVPKVLADGEIRGRAFVVESALPGTPGDACLGNGLSEARLLAAGAAGILPLYQATATSALADRALLEAWVDRPIGVLERALGDRYAAALTNLGAELHEALAGREITTSVTHGDLWPGNLLLDSDDATLTGIVDWEGSSPHGAPDVDLVHLLITSRAVGQGRELGDVVRELMQGRMGRHEPVTDGRLPDRIALVLAWLHHAAGHVSKSKRTGRFWVRCNVRPVLELWDERDHARSWARTTAAGWLAIGAGLLLWVSSIASVDPRRMADGGLLTVLPWSFWLALGILTLGFAVAAFRSALRPRLLGGYLLAMIAIIHATPILIYGTLRYSWAWKHVGVVDFIQRHEAVDTAATYLPVYHNWPGFFGLDALATGLAGLPGALGQAIWGPPFFCLLSVAAVAFVARGLTQDRRLIWLTCWLFVVANWVGQEYFSPQAFAFFLYLALIGVVLHWLDRRRPWALALALGLAVTITVSHPLTAVMASVALVALVAAGRCAYRTLPLVTAALTALWCLTFASDYTLSNLGSTLDAVHLPWATTGSSLTQTGLLSDTQFLVAAVARGIVVVICLLALLGVVRLVLSGRVRRAPVFLALAPLALFATGGYEGEILFRIYLFALPFLAYFAAHAFVPSTSAGTHPRWVDAASFASAALILVGALTVAYYGKERQYYYSPDEVAAAEYVYEQAPPGSLLIEGTRSYPGQFMNYERYKYVTLSREPQDSQARVVDDPVEVLSEWMTDPAYTGAYLIITRSQEAEVAEQGVMAAGSLERIDRALSRSPRFERVVDNRDAVVFVPAAGGPR